MSVVVILLYLLDIGQVPPSLPVFSYSLHDPPDLTAVGKEIELHIVRLIEFAGLNLNSFIFLNLCTLIKMS